MAKDTGFYGFPGYAVMSESVFLWLSSSQGIMVWLFGNMGMNILNFCLPAKAEIEVKILVKLSTNT